MSSERLAIKTACIYLQPQLEKEKEFSMPKTYVLFTLALMTLTACGGGGATTPATTTTPNGNVMIPPPDPCADEACVDTADWLGDFSPALTAAPDLANPRNQFLRATNTTLLLGGLMLRDLTPNIHDDNDLDNNLQTMTFNDVFYDGNNANGFATFIGEGTGMLSEAPNYYAGILSGTNLGLPMNEVRHGGIWSGMVTHNSTTEQYFVPMELNVKFSTKTIEAFTQLQNDFYLDIDGQFDERGIIILGTAISGTTNPEKNAIMTGNDKGYGVLTGLIGQDGAVGAFHSNDVCPTPESVFPICNTAFAGGFVAVPLADDMIVKYSDWETGANAARAPNKATRHHQFLRGNLNGLSRGDDSDLAGLSLHLADLRTDNSPLGGEEADGMRFYLIDASGLRHYAGLFSGTRLGLPINDISLNGTWKGIMNYHVGSTTGEVRDIDLIVNFGSVSSIRAFVPYHISDNTYFDLKGTFNNRGLITGTITYGFRDGMSDSIDPDSIDLPPNMGKITGLIGQEGVVGAFISNNDATAPISYAGGFVARPPNK